MGTIQSSVGLISGIDIETTVNKLIAVSARPRDALQSRTATLQTQQAAITDLLAQVIGVQLTTNRLGRVADFNSITANSSNRDVLTANASSSASPGTYSFHAIATAQTSSATSNSFVNADQKVTAGTLTVHTGGFIDQSASLDDLQGGLGIHRGKISITDRSGNSSEIDLRFATSIDDVLKAINQNKNIKVSASLSGDRIVLKDLTGATTSNLKVTEVDGGQTAANLGLDNVDVAANSATGQDIVFLSEATSLASLRDGRGIRFGVGDDLQVNLRDGTELEIDLNSSDDGNPVTLGQVLARINLASPTKLTARISGDGSTIEFEDLTSGSNPFAISDINGKAAQDLGIVQSTSNATITGTRLQSGLTGPLLASLNGGAGLGPLGTIQVTNRNNQTTSIDLSAAVTLRDVIDTINNSSAGIVATTNSTATGILLQDTTGATTNNLVITNADGTNSATQLKIAQNVAKSSIDSGSLGLQFIHENTSLESLNQGRGINFGSIKFTDSLGASATLNFATNEPKTLGDVIYRINNSGIALRADLNQAGDGLVLYSTGNGNLPIEVSDVGSGTSAADLGIAGTGATISVNGQNKNGIATSQNYQLALTSNDKLSDVVTKIQDSDGPIQASILRSGPNNVRLLVSSKASGSAGRVTFDGGTTGISLTTTTQARDAVIAIGASESSGGTVLRSATNSFDDIVPGLDITLSGTSSEAVQVQVNSGTSNVAKNVQAFVDQFNKVITKLKEVTKFDPNGKSNGVLFGASETLRVEFTLNRLVSSRLSGVGPYRSLEQLGLRINGEGKLDFDSARFNDALDANPEAVQKFFTTEDKGFAAFAKTMIDQISGEGNSLLTARSEAIQAKIDDNNQRIEALTLRLSSERTRIETQFFNLEKTIASLQNNQKAVAGISTLSIFNNR